MSAAEDDLNYKIQFQARLDAGSTEASLKALAAELLALEEAGKISEQAFNEIGQAIVDTRAQFDDLTVVVKRLASTSAVRGFNRELSAMAAEVRRAARDGAKEVADAEKVKRAEIKATALAAEEANKVYTLSATRSQLPTRLLAASPFDTSAISPELQSAADAITLSGLKATRQFAAAETAAKGEAKALYDGKVQIDAQVKSYEARNKQIETATKQESLYNQYLAEEAKALYANNQQIDAQVVAYERVQKAIEARTQSESLYNQYLREQTANTAAQVKAQELAANPVTRTQGLGNFYPLIVAAGIFGGLAKKTEDLGLAAGKMAADYQQAFASVARTANTEGANSAGQIDGIRKSLEQLDTQIPLSFTDLSKIATAGNEIGVSASGITGFTKTVAEYSQVTGTAADVTATAFGSLGQILKIPSTEYENFGSAVSLVGRKSVATEAQVLSMTAKIGASAHQANFTTSQILGLSGALASLQEAPERSQGALEIYFKNVNSAAAEGGKKLEAFASAVHMSASAAQDMIKNNPYGFLLELLKSIGNQKGIVAQTTMLQGLGLSATRVSEVLRRLSTNTDLLGNLTSLANQGYTQGTDLSGQYAKATDTLTAKFKELQNAFANFLATIGGSGLAQMLTGVVDGVKDVVIGITGFAQANPVITNLVVAFTALGGALLALRAVSLGATIATIALESAQVRLQGVSKLDGLKTLTGMLLGTQIGMSAAEKEAIALTAANERMIASMIDRGVVEDRAAAMRALGIAEATVGTEAEVAAGGVGVLRGALMTLGIPAILIGLTALATTLLSVNDTAANFDSTGLQNALKADQSTYAKTGNAIRQIATSTEVSKTSADKWVKSLNAASGGQAELNAKTTKTTSSIQQQTIAYGQNAKAFLSNTIANDAAFQKLFSDQKAASYLNKIGFDPGVFAQKLVNDPTGSAGRNYVKKYMSLISKDLASSHNGADIQGIENAAPLLRDLNGLMNSVSGQTQAAAAADAAFGSVAKATGQAVDSQTGAIVSNTQAKGNNAQQDVNWMQTEDATIKTIFASVNAFYAQTSALSTVGQEYVNSGAAAAFSGAAMQQYIQSVVDSAPTSAVAAQELTELRNSIVNAGYAASATAPSLGYLNAVLDSLGGATHTTAQATQTFPAFTDGLKQAQAALDSIGTSGSNAADGLAKTAKQIITVTDYAGNLSSTFKEAFDIRFGKQQGLDDISQQFQSMKDNADSARKSIQDAKNSIQQYEASISKTRADNANQKYFLSVAQQFGDSSRANDIQAQIDSNNASIASDTTSLKQAQLDLAAAEDKLNTSYTSNTAGAITNRQALYTLAQKYEDYISKLAASGASQKTLEAAVRRSKEAFDKQATSLGYSRDAIHKVDGAFGDMITIIKKIPPANISITGLSAGEAAVKNFMAKLNASVSSGVSGINNKLKGIHLATPEPTPMTPSKGDRELALRAEMAGYEAMYLIQTKNGQVNSNAAMANLQRIAQDRRDLLNGNYYEGGYTGPGGKYQPAGIVHRGEYVVPAHQVNQSTGLPYADALGRLISGAPAQSSYASGGFVNSDMMVTELGPRSLGVLRQLVNSEVVAVISAQNLTGAVNATNSANRRRGR